MRHARTFDRYLAVFGTVACLVLGTTAALHLRVDPQALFPMVHDSGLEGFRRNADRTTKAERLSRGVPPALLLGNSVANQIFDPASPWWDGKEVFCGGLAGGNLVETESLFKFALRHGRPERVVLVVDLRSVSGAESFGGDWAESRLNPEVEGTGYLLRHLFGWGAVDDSLGVLAAARPERAAEARTAADGFRSRPGFEHTWETFASVARGYMHEEYNRFVYGEDRIEVARRILRRCRAEGIRCTVVIPPQHAVLMETIRLMGLEGDFERMRREVGLAVLAASEEPGSEVEFWDFSGWSGPRGEPVPLEGKSGMRWFSDPVHANAALGEEMLGEMGVGADRWGRRLVPVEGGEAGLDRALAAGVALRKDDREAWLRDHPEEAERLRRLHEETAPERERRRRLWGAQRR